MRKHNGILRDEINGIIDKALCSVIMDKITDSRLKFGLLYISAALFALSFIVLVPSFLSSKVRGSDESDGKNKLVNIYDRGTKTSVISNSIKVKDAIKKSNIKLNEHDRVEPGLDTEVSNSEYNVNVYRARPVILVEGGIKKPIVSSYQTGEEIIKDAGIDLRNEDIVELEKADELTDGAGLRAIIKRATPINLTFFGKNEIVYTQSGTVGDFLDDRKIKFGENDRMSHARDDIITSNMDLRIWREGRQTITVEEDIPFSTEKIQDADKAPGFKEIRQPGKNGKRTATYDILIQDGVEVSRTEVNSIVISQPTKQVEVHGAKPSFSGDFAAALAKLRACEAGGNYANKRNPSYRGAYQFGYGTWGNKYGIYDPADATPAQQDQAARELYERRGWQPWPHCGASLPDVYR